MHQFLLYIGFGIVTASVLSLSAVALTLQYAVSRVANLAHGELLTIGAYAAYEFLRWTHSVPIAALGSALVGGLAGIAMNLGLIERFAGRPPIVTVIATYQCLLPVDGGFHAVRPEAMEVMAADAAGAIAGRIRLVEHLGSEASYTSRCRGMELPLIARPRR